MVPGHRPARRRAGLAERRCHAGRQPPRSREPGSPTPPTPGHIRGARRSLLCGEAADPEGPDAPGLLIVDDHWDVASVTPGIDRWLAELPGGTGGTGRLTSSVLAIAAQALASARRPAQVANPSPAPILDRPRTLAHLGKSHRQRSRAAPEPAFDRTALRT